MFKVKWLVFLGVHQPNQSEAKQCCLRAGTKMQFTCYVWDIRGLLTTSPFAYCDKAGLLKGYLMNQSIESNLLVALSSSHVSSMLYHFDIRHHCKLTVLVLLIWCTANIGTEPQGIGVWGKEGIFSPELVPKSSVFGHCCVWWTAFYFLIKRSFTD